MPRPCQHRHELLQYTDGEPYVAGTCRFCWLYVNREDYRRHWNNQPPLPRPESQPASGPGTELKSLLAWFGAVDNGKCGCRKFACRMDLWGPAGCRQHRDLILSKLQDAAFQQNIPMPKMLIAPILDRAISLAEKKALDSAHLK